MLRIIRAVSQYGITHIKRTTVRRILLIGLCVVISTVLSLIVLDIHSDTAKVEATSAAAPTIPPKGPYLISLGGSIAAGAGLHPIYHSHFPFACDQTEDSYAVTLAHDQHLPLIQMACSGAQSSHGLFRDQYIGKNQLIPQLAAIRTKVPDSIVTIFVGANDARWIHLEFQCFLHGCPQSLPQFFVNGLSTLSNNISTIIQTLDTAGAKVVLINQYFSVLNTDSANQCDSTMALAANRDFYQTQLIALNEAIMDGVQSANAPAVVVPLNFAGHGICSSSPWVQGLHDPRPFHPTDAGQQAIAAADNKALDSQFRGVKG